MSQRRYVNVIHILLEYHVDAMAQDTGTGKHCGYLVLRIVTLVLVNFTVSDLKIAQDEHGLIPLHLTSEGRGVEVTCIILEHGSKETEHDEQGLTPLHQALQHGHLGVVSVLFEYGADANAQDNDCCTPLHWHQASCYGHLEVLSSLFNMAQMWMHWTT